MSERIAVDEHDVLLLVDLQNDFCPGGALAVPGGDEIISLANRIAGSFTHVVLTQDWHPPGHLSFASSHPGAKPYDTIALPYGLQELWPDHCVQGSRGAEFHSRLAVPQSELVLRKGFHPTIDSYSAFRENDRVTKTGLAGYLRERGLRRLFIAGLALDFCVRYTAEDAQAEGFVTLVVEDACRAIDVGGSLAATWQCFAALRIAAISSDAIG